MDHKKKITITADDMGNALADVCTRDPVKRLIDVDFTMALILPIVMAEVMKELERKCSDE